MKLCFVCTKCFSENALRNTVSDRSKLQLIHSRLIIDLNCKRCGAINSIHLNNIYAKVSSLRLLSLFFTLIAVSSYLMIKFYNSYVDDRSFNIEIRGLGLVAIVGIVPILIWSVAYSADFERTRLFNMYKL